MPQRAKVSRVCPAKNGIASTGPTACGCSTAAAPRPSASPAISAAAPSWSSGPKP